MEKHETNPEMSKTKYFNLIICLFAGLMTLSILGCKNSNDQAKNALTVYTPQEAVEIFINGMIADDSDAMLSVVGRSDGSALDQATYDEVKGEMDGALSVNSDALKIKSFRVVSTVIDEDVAQCEIEVTFSNDSVSRDANTLFKGADGGWRLPFFE